MALKKKKGIKKSNISFIKTICCFSFLISAIGLCYSTYYGGHDIILWIMVLLLTGVGIFSPDEIKK
jgi:hypothetical protein